jgi:Fungal specific transcription factor domain
LFLKLTVALDLIGYCEGRTLLPKDNLWLLDVAPMIAGSECVKHSLLSFASTYVLDFVPKKPLQDRANYHYKMAVKLIGESLQQPESHLPGKEESLIASLMLLVGDDVVTWETRKPKHLEPRWYAAGKAARAILDHSDPGYKYHRPEHVETSNARHSMSNWIAYLHILAEAVTPLKSNDSGKIYPWLIHGGKNQTRKIHGGTGASPKLLHTFAQITHLSAGLKEVSDQSMCSSSDYAGSRSVAELTER